MLPGSSVMEIWRSMFWPNRFCPGTQSSGVSSRSWSAERPRPFGRCRPMRAGKSSICNIAIPEDDRPGADVVFATANGIGGVDRADAANLPANVDGAEGPGSSVSTASGHGLRGEDTDFGEGGWAYAAGCGGTAWGVVADVTIGRRGRIKRRSACFEI